MPREPEQVGGRDDPYDGEFSHLNLLSPETRAALDVHKRGKGGAAQGRPWQWARGLDACQCCGSDEHEHGGRGLCKLCYAREHYEGRIDDWTPLGRGGPRQGSEEK